MAVKAVRSATRVLAVLEAVAELQPAGLAAVTSHLDEDKSAVQRALATLEEDGWIRPVGGTPPRFELTARALVMATRASQRSDLRLRARPVLEQLRDVTGESVLLAVPDPPLVVTLDVVESRQMVRSAPHVGLVLPGLDSAAAQAIYAHLPEGELSEYLGGQPDRTVVSALTTVRRRGWALNRGDVTGGASGIAAAVLDEAGRPVAAIAVTAPTARLPRSSHDEVARAVTSAAAHLSAGR